MLSHVRANLSNPQHLTPTLKIRMTEPARCVVVPTAVESVNIQAPEVAIAVMAKEIKGMISNERKGTNFHKIGRC